MKKFAYTIAGDFSSAARALQAKGTVVKAGGTDLMVELEARLDGIEEPLAALRVFVDLHIDFHTDRRKEVFISAMEMRSLTPENRAVVARRTRYEDRLCGILEAGNAAGLWRVREPRVATYALIAMLSGVCTWFTPGGRLSKQALIDIYTDLVLRGLDAAPT